MSDADFEKFRQAWRGCTGDDHGAVAAFAEVQAQHEQPHREYHTLQHVRDVLAELNEAIEATDELSEREAAIARLAVWYHDVIYDVRRHDNEEKSAEFAGEHLREVDADPAVIEQVQRCILATTHTMPRAESAAAGYVRDADLAILAKPVDRFAAYEWGVRQEYGYVDNIDFARARAEILRFFAERDRIYLTDYFFKKYESAARGNLKRSIDRWMATVR